jgi:hypothetical protein
MLQYEPYKGKEITKELVEEISNNLNGALKTISKIIDEYSIPSDLPDNVVI